MAINVPIPLSLTQDENQLVREILRRAPDGTVKPFFVDYTNQRVGIGTLSPYAPFNVAVASYFDANATFMGGVLVQQSISVSGDATVSKNLAAGSLIVAGPTSLGRFLFIRTDGRISVGTVKTFAGSQIYIEGPTIFTGNLTALNNLTVQQNLNVDGDAMVSKNLAVGSLTVAGAASIPGLNLGAWVSWTPTYTGFSANPAGVLSRYFLIGKFCTVNVSMPNTGTSNATGFTMTAPFTAMATTNIAWSTHSQFTDNGVGSATPGFIQINSNSNVINAYTNDVGAAWTNANGKSASFVLTYETA